MVDTDFGGALSFRSMAVDGGRANLSGDPDDIVIELAKCGKDGETDEESKRATDLNNKARLRSKINAGRTGFGRAGSGGPTKADDFNNINHYVIDDDEDDEED